jgi:hypothetical protein
MPRPRTFVGTEANIASHTHNCNDVPANLCNLQFPLIPSWIGSKAIWVRGVSFARPRVAPWLFESVNRHVLPSIVLPAIRAMALAL